MQNRTCSCGHHIWVLYLPQNTSWKTFFYATTQHYHTITTCPHCGASLNIHCLR